MRGGTGWWGWGGVMRGCGGGGAEQAPGSACVGGTIRERRGAVVRLHDARGLAGAVLEICRSLGGQCGLCDGGYGLSADGGGGDELGEWVVYGRRFGVGDWRV